ncbi:hypothetical protein GGG16DRAFT_122472 [Schizophyllum commune]
MAAPRFDDGAILKYLGLDSSYTPSPVQDPIGFLNKNLTYLPPHLAGQFSQITTPKQRTSVPRIRNRRTMYSTMSPKELSFLAARNTWPHLWEGRERRGIEEALDEKKWAEEGFMPGQKKHVNKIGKLLGEYEEEREAERVRELRRERVSAVPAPDPEDDFVPEEDSESEDEDEDDVAGRMNSLAIHPPAPPPPPEPEETDADRQVLFERIIRERFIYGLLDGIDYDKVDWDESLDSDEDREAEERWFDEDDDEE